MRIRVADATQLNVAGRTYRAGEEFEVANDDRAARIWLARGWAEQLDAAAQAEPEPAPEGGDKPAADKEATTPAGESFSQTEPIADAALADASRDDLRAEAGRLGLSKSGSKEDLLKRIRAARAG